MWFIFFILCIIKRKKVGVAMTVDEVYKALLLKEQFSEESKELYDIKNRLLDAGVISKEKLLKIWISTAVIIGLFWLFMDLLLHGVKWTTFLFSFAHFLVGACLAGIIVTPLYFYSFIKEKKNYEKYKDSEEMRYYQENVTVVERNLETVNKMLESERTIKKKYQKKEILEKLLEYGKRGRAQSVQQAIYIFHVEHPNYFKVDG